MFSKYFKVYNGIKSRVAYNGEQSFFFQSFRGVRQGENLSPVLFALFLNDKTTKVAMVLTLILY